MRLAKWFYTVPLHLRSIFKRRQVEQDLQDELQYHLDMKTEENLAKGLGNSEARRYALIDFGGLDQKKEECRDARAFSWIDSLARDVRFAFRMLSKNKVFSPGLRTICVLLGHRTCLQEARISHTFRRSWGTRIHLSH